MRFRLLLGLLVLVSASAGAECTYFRVGYRFLHCALEPQRVSRADTLPQEPAELQEISTEAVVRVTCSCDYSLRGSDLLCDVDQTKEISELIGSEDPAGSCRRGKNLCSNLCPKRLP